MWFRNRPAPCKDPSNFEGRKSEILIEGAMPKIEQANRFKGKHFWVKGTNTPWCYAGVFAGAKITGDVRFAGSLDAVYYVKGLRGLKAKPALTLSLANFNPWFGGFLFSSFADLPSFCREHGMQG